MALGAQRGDVVWLFVRRALVPLGIGLAAGIAGALALGPLLRGFLVQTSPGDPATLAAVAGTLIVVAAAASVWPAMRATRVDPAITLRGE
jgi:putative ABC transport system permease protein